MGRDVSVKGEHKYTPDRIRASSRLRCLQYLRRCLTAAFGSVEDPELQRFNLKMMVSGILFRAALAPPERLDAEIDEIRTGLVSVVGERMKART